MSDSRGFETDFRFPYTVSMTRTAENTPVQRRVPRCDPGTRPRPHRLKRVASLCLAVLLFAALIGPTIHDHADGSPSSSCVICHVAPDRATGAAEISLDVPPHRIALIPDTVTASEPLVGDLLSPAHAPRAPPLPVPS